MKDFVLYKIQLISNAHFENPVLLLLSLAQKEHINAILNAQVIFTRDCEL
jgi:hypothetical protein